MAAIRKSTESTYVFLDIKDNTLDDIDNTHVLENQSESCPLSNGLGALDRLSLEIIHLALIRLDIQSLVDFRRVNKERDW